MRGLELWTVSIMRGGVFSLLVYQHFTLEINQSDIVTIEVADSIFCLCSKFNIVNTKYNHIRIIILIRKL
jgi:hypothetical protein